MTKDTSDVDTASVMVATHDKNRSTSLQNPVLSVPSTSTTGSGPSLSQFIPQASLGSQFGGASQFFPQSGGASQFSPQFGGSQQFSPQFGGSQFTPQGFPQAQTQFSPNSFRSVNRGRGRGSRFPRDPCDICGKTNHTTSYCRYRPTFQPFDTAQWRGGPSQMPYYPPPVYQGQGQFYPSYQGQFSAPRVFAPNVPFSGQQGYTGGYSGPRQVQEHFAGQTSSFPGISSQNYGWDTLNQGYSAYGGFNGGTTSQSSVPQQSSMPQQWYFDSGATNHITHTLQNIDQPHSSSLNNGVLVGNGSSLPVSHIGKGLFPTPKTAFQLTNILHTPSITHNLISVYQFSKDNHCSLIF